VTPQDGALVVSLYGKTADLVRAECRERQMSADEFVKQVVLCWAMDLAHQRQRAGRAPEAAVRAMSGPRPSEPA
jgi:hypothetical protein